MPLFKTDFGNTLQSEVVISVLWPGKLCNHFDSCSLVSSLTIADKHYIWAFCVACEYLLKLTCFLMQTLCRLQPDNGKSVCNLSRAGCNLSQWVSIISGAAEEFIVEFSFFNCLLKSHTKSNSISYIHPADSTVFYNKV